MQVGGHFAASLDPLGIQKKIENPNLSPALYNFTEADMDREYASSAVPVNPQNWGLTTPK